VGSLIRFEVNTCQYNIFSDPAYYNFNRVGCDGARSKVVEHIQLPFITKSTGGTAINVHFKMDIEPQMRARISNLTYTYPMGGEPFPSWGEYSIVRMIKPWSEWILILFPSDPTADVNASEGEIMKRARELIGDDDVPIDLIAISYWTVNESYATNYQRGRIFGMGDAVHRHPRQCLVS